MKNEKGEEFCEDREIIEEREREKMENGEEMVRERERWKFERRKWSSGNKGEVNGQERF